jgi:imidazolonepropionase-like amidohydrolase
MEAEPMTIALLAALVALQQVPAATPSAAAPRPDTLLIRAGRLIDGRSDEARTDQGILVAGERIGAVGPWAEVSRRARGARVIDLSHSTVLPGLIDDHTHILLQGDVTSQDYDTQLLEQSIPYRALLASRNVRWALLEGYTALRDVETEGAMYADVDVKRAINRGVIPGPRLFVSTRAMAPTGMYPIQSDNWELELPKGVEIVDGPDAIRRAVREQVSHGADWIKFYADRRYYMADDGTIRSWVNFTDDELQALVGEAHRLGRPVAAHAIGRDGIEAALRAGVNSIEHGMGITDSLARVMAQRGVYWCPTIYVTVYVAPGRAAAGAPIWQQLVEAERRAFASALRAGVKIANGTDAGGFPWTEPLARDFTYMVRYGMTPMQAIRTGTSVAAELLGRQDEFGSIAPGHYADIIAVAGDPLQDISELERVKFVMKGGTVYKQE